MNKFARSGRLAPAVAALVALAGSLGTAAAARADVSVSVRFLAGTIGFSSSTPPVYILAAGVNATGFTDDSNLYNYIRLDTDAFSSDLYPARGTGSGTTGSNGYSGVADLNAAINSGNPGTLRLYDAVTGLTSTYAFSISTPGFTNDQIRPIYIDGVPDNSIISDSPTFNFIEAAAIDPQNADTDLFAGLLAGNPANHVFSPPVNVGDTSWTPTAPLAADTYTMLVISQNNGIDQSLMDAGPGPIMDGPDILVGPITVSLFIQNSDQRAGLRVLPTPGASAVLGAAGLVATRRRRR